MNWFRSAISEGGDVDPGYSGFMTFTYLTAFVVVAMAVGLFIQQSYDPQHKFDALQLGQGMALAGAAFTGVAVSVGTFRRLDKTAAPSSTTTKSETTETKT